MSNNDILLDFKSPQELGKILVVYGGDNAEHEISCQSGQAVIRALQKVGADVHGYQTDNYLLQHLIDESYDVVFIALHGENGEDGTMQALLTYLDVPYTGSNPCASALAMDKFRSKLIFNSLNIATPEAYLVRDEEECAKYCNKIGFPVAVKSVASGSSRGVTKVCSASQITEAYLEATRYPGGVMVEKWISGREYFVGILGSQLLPPVAVEPAQEFYDYEAKYFSGATKYECPADLDPSANKYLADLSLGAFLALGCENWGRVDCIQDADGKFWVLEVNTIPGMTESSLVPKAAAVCGIDFATLVLSILSRPQSGKRVARQEYVKNDIKAQ